MEKFDRNLLLKTIKDCYYYSQFEKLWQVNIDNFISDSVVVYSPKEKLVSFNNKFKKVIEPIQ